MLHSLLNAIRIPQRLVPCIRTLGKLLLSPLTALMRRTVTDYDLVIYDHSGGGGGGRVGRPVGGGGSGGDQYLVLSSLAPDSVTPVHSPRMTDSSTRDVSKHGIKFSNRAQDSSADSTVAAVYGLFAALVGSLVDVIQLCSLRVASRALGAARLPETIGQCVVIDEAKVSWLVGWLVG